MTTPAHSASQRNGLAAVLAGAGLAALLASLALPFVESTTPVGTDQWTLPGSVARLFEDGEWLLAAILGLFSIVFPIVKLIAIILAATHVLHLPPRRREQLARLALATGKWSILDVLVLAVIIVVAKMQGIATVAAREGTVLFCIAVAASMIAGIAVKPNGGPVMDPHSPQTTQARRRARFPWPALPFVLLLAASVFYVLRFQETGVVTAIRVEPMPASMTLQSLLLDTRTDLYLKVGVEGRDEPTRLPTIYKTPIGNGLTWTMVEPTALETLTEIALWDEDLVRDDQLDRVDVEGWLSEGRHFTFECYGDRPEWWTAALGTAFGCGVIVLFALLKYLYDLAV